ncbi:MAG: hypothetical protein ABWX74_11795 [Aeromicrobium sp.]
MTDAPEVVRAFFSRWPAAGFILPDGWIGRPYDDYAGLESVSVDGGRLTIRMDSGHVLVVDDDATVRDVGGSLLISRFGQATFGSDPNHLDSYREGVVEFVGNGAERADQVTRDEG